MGNQEGKAIRISFLGNFSVPYSSESHHAKSLEALGHEVIRLQERESSSEEIYQHAVVSSLFVWVHTHGWHTPGNDMSWVLRRLQDQKIPSVTYHLDLWFGLDRQKDLESDPFYREIEWFFATDKLMCDWFNENTEVKGRYLPAGVYHEECGVSQIMMKQKEVIFVGSKGYHPEWSYRPQLINWLASTYGHRFEHWGGDGLGTVRGFDLNRLYANSKVTVGDSLVLNFDYPYYWSDRVYETMGRGGFLIMPFIKGLDEQFKDGEHLIFYEFGNFDQLKEKIDYYLANDDAREKIRLAGHEEVKARHTYKHRWEHILKEVFSE